MGMILAWMGATIKKGDFTELKPPIEGEDRHRYYDEATWLKSRKASFIGNEGAQTFGKEKHLAGPISDFCVHYGAPGLLEVIVYI